MTAKSEPPAPPTERIFNPDRTGIVPLVVTGARTILPGTRCTVALGNAASLGAVKEALRSPQAPVVGFFPAVDVPGEAAFREIGPFGTLAVVRNLQRHSQNRWTAELYGFARGRRHQILRKEPFAIGQVEWIPDRPADPTIVAALIGQVRALTHGDIRGSECQHRRIGEQMQSAPPEEIAGVATSLLPELPTAAWLTLLEADNLEDRLALVLAHLYGSRVDRPL